jgi:hypothetical protein
VCVVSSTPEHVLHTKILQKVIGQAIRVVRATWAQAQAVQNLGSLSPLTPTALAFGAACTTKQLPTQ